MATKFSLISVRKDSYPLIEENTDVGRFFIIKQGRVSASNSSLPYGKKGDEILCPGDFFGVTSCMAQRPRLYSIHALEDCLLISVERAQFNDLIKHNNPIAMKIIRYFSKQLRFFNDLLSKMSSASATDEENPCLLYDTAEYYISKRKSYQHAGYALTRYLELCQNGDKRDIARQKLEAIKKNIPLKLDPIRENFVYLYEENKPVFLEHEIGNELYIIQEGEIKITRIVDRHEVLLNVLKPGDIFGEMAILENKLRNANALTACKVKLMAVSKDNFSLIVNQHPEIATRIIRFLSDRIWFMHRHITNMMIKDPVTRLFDALYTHLLRDRIPIIPHSDYTFSLSWEDLLKFTSLQTPDGYQALEQALQRNPNFTIKDGKIYCKNISFIEESINVIQRKRDIKASTTLG